MLQQTHARGPSTFSYYSGRFGYKSSKKMFEKDGKHGKSGNRDRWS